MHHVPTDMHQLGRQARHVRRLAGLNSAVAGMTKPTFERERDGKPAIELKALSFADRSGNELRPATFEQMVGQARLKRLMRRIVDTAQRTGRPLDHIMLAGQSGTGKTTLAQVIAHECRRTVYQVKAPVALDVLAAIARQCKDGDVVIVDEIHQQVVGDRRGATQAADPEDFYHALEDRRLPMATGMMVFPAVTFMGCTTDSGLLPEAFLGRFPLTLTLDPYTYEDMAELAIRNAEQLKLTIDAAGAATLGLASRRNPRQLNTFIRNCSALGGTHITGALATEVVEDLNGCTPDGLTPDMQGMLRCLLRSRRETRDGRVTYQASVNTVSTAIGHSRDTKHIVLYVEPYLIAEGYVAVTHGGRTLTDLGLQRALELT